MGESDVASEYAVCVGTGNLALQAARDGWLVLCLVTSCGPVKPTAIEPSQLGLPARSTDRTSFPFP